MKRAARSIRSGSSVKLTSGASGVRSTPRREVGGPAERIDELGHRRAGELERHRVDGEVRRDRSDSMSSANTTCGLRESSVYDSARNVVIS